MTKTVEYRVRPVIRYHVTRYERDESESGACGCGLESLGEFDNESQAFKIADALYSSERARFSTEIYKFQTLVMKKAEPLNTSHTFSDKETK